MKISGVYYVSEYDIICIIHESSEYVLKEAGFVRYRSIELVNDLSKFSPLDDIIDRELFNKMEYIGEL